MKRIAFVCCLLTAVAALYANGIQEELDLRGEKSKVSYALGMAIADEVLGALGIDIDYTTFAKGVKDSIEGNAQYTMDEAIGIIETVLQAANDQQMEENRIKEELFLAANGQRPEVIITESGLQYEVITEGDGPKPTSDDVVMVHYEGILAVDGSVFDSSYKRGAPTEFVLGDVIPGWDEGLQLMSVGSKYRFYIPSNLAYGEYGVRAIPPYSTLVFTVELLEINPAFEEEDDDEDDDDDDDDEPEEGV